MMSGNNNDALHSLFSVLPFGIILFSTDGQAIYINDAIRKLLNTKPDNLLGKSVEDVIALFNSICAPDLNPQPLTTEIDPDGKNYILDTGALKVVHCSMLEFNKSPDGLSNKILYFRDSTRDYETDRLRGEFIAKATHQLRTPLANILGFTELLLAGNYDDETRTDVLNTVHRQSITLRELLNDLLQLARIEAHQGTGFVYVKDSLEQPLVEVVDQLGERYRERPIKLIRPAHWPLIRFDREKIHLAFSALIDNALKFSTDGQSVEIECRAVARNDFEMFGVEIIDHGVGISAQDIDHVGERFFRSDNVSGLPGTGLGMALAREIIGIHGGNIEISSQVDTGTRVMVWLPVCDTP